MSKAMRPSGMVVLNKSKRVSSTPDSFAPMRFAQIRSAPDRYASSKCEPCRSQPSRSARWAVMVQIVLAWPSSAGGACVCRCSHAFC